MTIYDADAFDSPQEAIAHYKELLKALGKRKRALEVKLAKYGVDAPAYMETELEDVNEQIQQLRERVKKLEASINPPSPATVTPKPTSTPPKFDWAEAVRGLRRRQHILREISTLTEAIPKRPVTLSILARNLQMKESELALTVNILEKDGYIERMTASLFRARLYSIPVGTELLALTTEGREWLQSQEP